MGILGKIFTAVASNVLSSKILGTDEQKAQIGSGTAPSLQSGPPIEMTPIEGSVRQDFGDFDAENFAESPQNEQDRLMELILMEQMKDEGGVASLYNGGYLNRFGGGSLGIMDLLNMPEIEIDPNLVTPEMPQAPEATPFANITKWFESLDPEMQEALMAGGGRVGAALFERIVSGKREQPGSQVSTQTLPGNSARRRAAQMNIKPIQGSVRAADGGVLDRRMFAQNYMPDGGDITGPGGPKDDLIPVMASNGEYMLSKAAVDQAGGGNHAKGVATLEAFNELGNMRYG